MELRKNSSNQDTQGEGLSRNRSHSSEDSPREGLSRNRSHSSEDSPRDRSPKKHLHIDSPARHQHVINYDPMRLEAEIASRHNNQTDQSASTSSSGSERGGLGQKDLSPQTKDPSFQMLEHRFQSLLERADDPQTIRDLYQATDHKQELLSYLDHARRNKLIEDLSIDDLAKHFETLERSDQRNEFLGWLGLDRIVELDNKVPEQQIAKFYRVIPQEVLPAFVEKVSYNYQEVEDSYNKKINLKNEMKKEVNELQQKNIIVKKCRRSGK